MHVFFQPKDENRYIIKLYHIQTFFFLLNLTFRHIPFKLRIHLSRCLLIQLKKSNRSIQHNLSKLLRFLLIHPLTQLFQIILKNGLILVRQISKLYMLLLGLLLEFSFTTVNIEGDG